MTQLETEDKYQVLTFLVKELMGMRDMVPRTEAVEERVSPKKKSARKEGSTETEPKRAST